MEKQLTGQTGGTCRAELLRVVSGVGRVVFTASEARKLAAGLAVSEDCLHRLLILMARDGRVVMLCCELHAVSGLASVQDTVHRFTVAPRDGVIGNQPPAVKALLVSRDNPLTMPGYCSQQMWTPPKPVSSHLGCNATARVARIPDARDVQGEVPGANHAALQSS